MKRRFDPFYGLRRRRPAHPSAWDSSLALNQRALAGELARARLDQHGPAPQPVIVGLGSKPCTQADMDAPWLHYWIGQMGEQRSYHRAAWEPAFIMQALYEEGLLTQGSRFLALDDHDAVALLLQKLGCIVQTAGLDRPFKNARLEDLPVNAGYDGFLSRSGAGLMGNPERAAAFIAATAGTLRAGGLAVHTFDFAYADDPVVDYNGKAFALKAAQIEAICDALGGQGYSIDLLSFDPGADVFDRYVDLPPFDLTDSPALNRLWRQGGRPPHIKALVGGVRTTSYGLIIRREV